MITKAFLMAILAMFNANHSPYAWYLFREPVMAGFWVGLIFGRPVDGVMIGATINVAYLGWISAGGSQASDLHWAGLLGTLVALQSGLAVEAAAALAVPIGILGNYVHVAWLSLNSVWPTKMDKLAAKGNYKALALMQVCAGPLTQILFRALPIFIITYLGSDYIQIIVNMLPVWSVNGFAAIGKILPALGMAMLLKYMAKKEVVVFFALGFLVSAYFGITDLLFFALVGVCLAYLYLIKGKEGSAEGVN